MTLRFSLSAVLLASTLIACGTDDVAEVDVASAGETPVLPEGSLATEVVLDLRDGASAFLNLETMEVTSEEPERYDLYARQAAPHYPLILLHPDVAALNLGNTTTFCDLDVVPADGYSYDVTTEDGLDLVIGDTFWEDHVETTLIMSQNVYALRLADGTYAKIAFVSGEGGRTITHAFRQADGTTDMESAP